MTRYLSLLFFGIISLFATSQSVEGYWATYDDETGKLESEVKLYLQNGKLYGKIIKLHDNNPPNAKCDRCPGERKNQPIVGMIFMNGLTHDGKEWTGKKTLLHPENGKEYDGKVWLVNDDKLAVRGYLGWFYRTQYWVRRKQ